MTRVVLASASPARRRVLRDAGIEPVVVVSGVDEDMLVSGLAAGADASTVTTALAGAKADAVACVLPEAVTEDSIVIGCDSLLSFGGRMYGKPASATAARRQWASMAGGTGLLHTGHCVIRLRHGVAIFRAAEASVSRVRFGTPPAADLEAYLASEEPLTVAGAFTLDGLGGWFVESVDGVPSGVLGLALPLVRRLFERAGLSMTALWAANPPD